MTQFGSRFPLFVRLTAIVAAGIVALFVLVFVLKVIVFAAIVAAIVVGAIGVWNFVQRRRSGAMPVSVRR